MLIGCQLNVCLADEYIDLVENYIYTIKERSRCVVSMFLFKLLLGALSRRIVESRNFWLNSSLQKEGTSKSYCLRTIVMGKNTNCNKYCQLEKGQYVFKHKKTDDTKQTRTEPAIYLYPPAQVFI